MVKDTSESAVAGCLFAMLLLPVGAIVRGLVLSKLWAWFVVPFGASEIGTVHALGLSLIASVVLIKSRRRSSTDEPLHDMVVRSITHLVIEPLILLLMGYIAHMCM